MNPENPFAQIPFEVDPAIKAKNESLAAEQEAHEAEHGAAPMEQIDPREYYEEGSAQIENVEELKEKHPEAYELAVKLSNPHVEEEDFKKMITDWNEAMVQGGSEPEGNYSTARFPIDPRLNRNLEVKYFENGRVIFKSPSF